MFREECRVLPPDSFGWTAGEQPLAVPAHGYNTPRISPDGRRISVNISETSSDIWIYDISRGALSRASFEGTGNIAPVWTPDGKRIAYQSSRADVPNIFWQPADGSGTAERLTTSAHIQVASSFSPDGKTILFMEVSPESGRDVWTLRIGDQEPKPFLRTKYNESSPRFSPDGHWVSYVSDESGREEVYVQAYPGPGGKSQVSIGGGREPVWNPAGHELFYRSGNRMMAAVVTLQPEFSASKPAVLFEGPWLPTALTFANYDVSSDGQRFLMLKAADEEQGALQIVVVQNWIEDLKRRLAAGKK
jgi:eukaryotic-like serine/threonine-protein kinase